MNKDFSKIDSAFDDMNGMYDDGFGIIPIEDEWFLPERDSPKSSVLESRPLQKIIINQRTWVKDNVEDHLDVIDNMTSAIFNYLKNDENVTSLEISDCKSKCTFMLSGEKIDFALTWFWQYTVNWTIIRDKMYNHRLLDKIYAAIFLNKITENYPNYTIYQPHIDWQSISISMIDPDLRFNSEEHGYKIVIRRKDCRVFVIWKWMDKVKFEKSFMIDDFLKNLPETYLGIKKIEK